MSAGSDKREPEPPHDPASGGAEGASPYRGPGVETEPAPGGGLPGVLRFFVVPLVLVGASLAVFAGLGAVVDQGPPSSEDLVRQIAEGGKNARWQAAQELSNQVSNGQIDLRRDERLTRTLALAFENARQAGDDPRILQHLAVLLGRARPDLAGPVLRTALSDGNPDVRIFVAAALAQQADPGDVETLLARLDDLDPGVRAVAAYAAATVIAGSGGPGKPEWRAALAKALRDPDVDVQWNAALALARLDDPAGADLIWDMLHRDYVRGRLKSGEGPGAGTLFTAGGADPASPAEREERVVLNALSAAYRLRDRSMGDGVKALAASDESDSVKDWALRASAELAREGLGKAPVPQRTWTAAR